MTRAERRLCGHLESATAGSRPLVVDLVLADRQGLADALTHCPVCEAPYLIELLDRRGPRLTHRTFKLSSVPRSVAAGFRRDIARGSCDVARAAAECDAVVGQAQSLDRTIALDIEGMTLLPRS